MENYSPTGMEVLVLVLLVGLLIRLVRTRKVQEAAKVEEVPVVEVQEEDVVIFFDAPPLEMPEEDAEDTLPFIRLPFLQDEKPTTEFVARIN